MERTGRPGNENLMGAEYKCMNGDNFHLDEKRVISGSVPSAGNLKHIKYNTREKIKFIFSGCCPAK